MTDKKIVPQAKPRVAVHKFSSCDGCQLAFINMGEDLLTLTGLVDIVHFAEAGPVDIEAKVDVAFVEGSISTPEEMERIQAVRQNSAYVVAIGACATAGGLQALRNLADVRQWTNGIYSQPTYIHSLQTATPLSQHIKVDLELQGCPVNGRQVIAATRALLNGFAPIIEHDKICLECKRTGAVCVMVTRGVPCMGPVTLTGCGALCPRSERDCYSCFGPAPAEEINTESLARQFAQLGLTPAAIARRFLFINNAAPVFNQTGRRRREQAQ